MKKINERKAALLKEINDLSNKSLSITIVDYSKITSLELKQIRKKLFAKNFKTKVFKNKLTQKAIINTNNNTLSSYITGQILMIFSESEISEPLKIINYFTSKNANLKIKATCVYGKVFINENLKKITNLNSTDDQLCNLIYTIKYPIIKLSQILNLIITNKKGDQNENK